MSKSMYLRLSAVIRYGVRVFRGQSFGGFAFEFWRHQRFDAVVPGDYCKRLSLVFPHAFAFEVKTLCCLLFVCGGLSF